MNDFIFVKIKKVYVLFVILTYFAHLINSTKWLQKKGFAEYYNLLCIFNNDVMYILH